MQGTLNTERALGLIETRGLVGAVEAADAMVKAAKVKLHPTELSTGALVVVKVTGEVGAVRSAIDAGSRAAEKVGQLISTHIIPRPHDETEEMVFLENISYYGEEQSLDFSAMTVKELRALARRVHNLGLSGREISTANKETLVRVLKHSQAVSHFCRFPNSQS